MYSPDDCLMISGLQHFRFCRRQWALIHIEQQWAENLRTVEGNLLHERAHNEQLRESRGDLLIVRGLRVQSLTLGLTGPVSYTHLDVYKRQVPTVSIVPPLSVAISSSSAILSWNIEGDAPESWTVTITGADDYSDTQIVSTPSVTFEGLTPGETYEVIISTPTMLQSVSTTITPVSYTHLDVYKRQLHAGALPEA